MLIDRFLLSFSVGASLILISVARTDLNWLDRVSFNLSLFISFRKEMLWPEETRVEGFRELSGLRLNVIFS